MITCCICEKDINDNKYHRLGSITVCMNCYSEFSENMKKIRLLESISIKYSDLIAVGQEEPKKPFTTSKSKDAWETVRITDIAHTQRLKVFGGWFLDNICLNVERTDLQRTSIFVPDAKHELKIED